MSKRKKVDPNLEEEEEEDDDDNNNRPQKQQQQQQTQKTYDFHKKTIEVYPERLRELNRQFLSSINSQITTEPYSVLVGNCLDYVRQYFNYEDDLLQYSPWLVTRLKQSRSDIVKCLQETIDVYDALARHDFDSLFDKNTNETLINKTNNTPSFQFQPTPPPPPPTTTTTTSSSVPLFTLTRPTTTTAAPPGDSIQSSGFNFKLSTTTTAQEKTTTTNVSPFTFSIPNTGFGTSTFSAPNFGSTINTEKTATSSASSISFASPPKFSFAPTPATTAGVQQGTTEDNEDEPNEPPEPEKVEHETDAKLTYRCRMGVNKAGKLIKRGPVQVILKEANEKHQLIVRSDDPLGRLYLNILWSKLIVLKKNSTKDLTFVCQLNPAMTEIKEGEFVTILFRFDNETDRNDAYDKLDKERT